MEENKIRGIALSFLVFITTLASTYLFSLMNLSLNHFLTINIFPVIEALMSVNGIVFVFIVALPIAIILLIGEEFDYYHALLFAETGYILGAIVGLILFGLFEWLLPIIFAALGIAWSIKWLLLRESELKSKLKFSAGSGAAEKIILVSLVGFVIIIAMNGFVQKEALGNSFAEDLMTVTVGDQDNFKESVTDLAIGISVNSQRAIIKSLTELDSYQALSEKNDIDVLTFVAQMEAIKSQINMPEYSETMKETVETESGEFDITSQIIEQLPLMGLREHMWIIYSFFALILAHMIGSLFVKNIAALYYVVLKTIYGKMFLSERKDTFESRVEKEAEQEVKDTEISKRAGVKGPIDKDDFPD